MNPRSQQFSRLVVFLAGLSSFLLFQSSLSFQPSVTVSAQDPDKRDVKPQTPATKESDTDVVRVETDLVTTLFTAVDKDRRFVTTLNKEDLRIKENGVEQQITLFERETDRPLSIGFLVDRSMSQERTLPNEKRAAKKFVDAVVRPNKDAVVVLSFHGRPHIEAPASTNLDEIKAAINKIDIQFPADGCTPDIPVWEDARCYTSIWDSVAFTAQDLLSRSGKGTRRVIILLTDGDDTSSQLDRDDAVKAAISNDVVIYGIGVGDPELYKIERGSLAKLAEKTGGRAYFPVGDEELNQAFVQIEEEMRSQYVVAYTPINRKRDGSYRKLKLEVVNAELRERKLKLLHRQGYYAKKK
jgi:VWFA-related protein